MDKINIELGVEGSPTGGKPPVQVGILGLGRSFLQNHMRALSEMRDYFRVVALCDVEKPRRDVAAETFSEAHLYRRINDMMDDTEMELLFISLPSAHHERVALAGLRHGLWTITETPMSFTYDGAAKMRAAIDAVRAGELDAEPFRPGALDVLVVDSVAALVPRILKLKTRPTAIFCSCDAVARHAMRALEANGVKVPQDLSLVGFDDDPIAEWTTPALTTVRQSFTSIGRAAAEKLLALVAHADTPRESVAVPVAFIRRGSLMVKIQGEKSK